MPQGLADIQDFFSSLGSEAEIAFDTPHINNGLIDLKRLD